MLIIPTVHFSTDCCCCHFNCLSKKMFLPTLSILSVAGFAGEDLRYGVGGSGGRGGAGPVHGGAAPQLDQGRDGVRGHPQDRQGDHALQGENKCVQITQQNN